MDEGHQPLLEPAVLVSENCPRCSGTGRIHHVDGTGDVNTCPDCEGIGRLVREAPMSEAWDMMQAAHARVVAPPPSLLRERS